MMKRYGLWEEQIQAVLEEQMQAGLDGKVEGDLQVEFVQGGQLPINLGHELEEEEDHPIRAVYEKVEGVPLERQIQRSTRVWLEGEEGLSLQVELEVVDCCGREELNVVDVVLVWVGK